MHYMCTYTVEKYEYTLLAIIASALDEHQELSTRRVLFPMMALHMPSSYFVIKQLHFPQ
jgi:hypothetical protein